MDDPMDITAYLIPDSVEFTDEQGSTLERFGADKQAHETTMPHGHITSVAMGFARLPHSEEMTKLLGSEIFAFLSLGINGKRFPIAFVEDVEHMKVWVDELKDQLDNFDPDAVQWGPPNEGMSA